MIPDFPEEKKKLVKFWNDYLATKHRQLLGFVGEIPSHFNHEGDLWTIIGENETNETVEENEYQEIKGEFVIDLKEVPNFTPEKIREKLDQVAEEMARQMAEGVIRNITEAANKTGNIIDSKGKPFNQETFLQLLEKIDVSFDPKGNLIHPSIIMHPTLWATKKEEFRAWENDPQFKARNEEIIERKKKEWYVREARRKLVD